MPTVTVDVDVDLQDFDDDDVLEYARDLEGYNSGEDFAELAMDAYIAIVRKDDAKERELCRKLIEEITGRII